MKERQLGLPIHVKVSGQLHLGIDYKDFFV